MPSRALGRPQNKGNHHFLTGRHDRIRAASVPSRPACRRRSTRHRHSHRVDENAPNSPQNSKRRGSQGFMSIGRNPVVVGGRVVLGLKLPRCNTEVAQHDAQHNPASRERFSLPMRPRSRNDDHDGYIFAHFMFPTSLSRARPR
jgi:hypothetical protein